MPTYIASCHEMPTSFALSAHHRAHGLATKRVERVAKARRVGRELCVDAEDAARAVERGGRLASRERRDLVLAPRLEVQRVDEVHEDERAERQGQPHHLVEHEREAAAFADDAHRCGDCTLASIRSNQKQIV